MKKRGKQKKNVSQKNRKPETETLRSGERRDTENLRSSRDTETLKRGTEILRSSRNTETLRGDRLREREENERESREVNVAEKRKGRKKDNDRGKVIHVRGSEEAGRANLARRRKSIIKSSSPSYLCR